jgi:hypothetical protein
MISKDKYDDIFDQMLKYAAKQRMEDLAIEFPLDDEFNRYHSYSSEFSSNMVSFIKKAKKRGRAFRVRRVILQCAIIAVIFIAVSTVVIYNVEAFRVPFLNMFNQNNDESITINIKDEKANYESFGDKISGMNLPTYIPDGYRVDSIDLADTMYIVVYCNDNGDEVVLQSLYEGNSVLVDNEDAVSKDITVNNESAQFFDKNGMRTLIYEFNNNYFLLNGIISENELFNIAESMEYYP